MKFASTTPVHIPMRSPADLRSPFGIFSKSVFGAIGRRVSCVVAFGELSSGSSDASAISDFSISPSLWKAAFSWVFLLCVLSGWLQGRPASAQAPAIPCVYDAVIGFSNTQSSASRWQYGYYPSPTSTTFIPYGSYNAALYPNIDAWSSSSAMAPAMVLHNRAATTQTYSTVTQPADVLNFHPGPNGEKSVLRWTSPFAGQVALTGRFQGLDSQGGTTDVAIKWSGSSTPLFSSYVGLNGQGQNTPYSVTATVAVGDTLDFVVGYGNGYYGADSTGIAATIVKTVYNPVTDFAGPFNPGGAGRWICGYTSSPSSTTFIPYTSYNAAVIPNVEGWGAASPVGPPMVLHNKTNTAQTSGTITIPPDALNVHPGPNGEKSVVRWTASFAGTVAITGRFLGLDSVGTSTDVSIKWSGSATPLFSSYVGLNNQGYNIPYSVTTSVVAGDTIDFVVGYGNGYYWNDSTGLAANLSFTSYPPPLAPPNAPVLSATPGNAQATLSWNPVNGVATYKLYRSTTLGGGYSLVIDNLTGTSYTDTGFTNGGTGLTNGTTYYYFIKAFSSAGVGGEINPGVSVTPVAPPSAPVLTAAPGNASATLSWNTVSGATGYKLFRSTTSGTYSATPLATLGGVTSYSDSGLTNGTTYYYVLKATGAGGDSPASSEVSAAPLAAPSAPASLSATPGNAQIALSWPSVANATSYQVFRSTQSNNFGTIPTQTVTTVSWTSTGLTNGTTYYYVVRAVGVGGPSLPSPQASATPLAAPVSPTALVATAGNAQVALSWTGSANATGYKIFRATTTGGYGATPLATPTGTSYTDTTATNGTTYFYVVKATGVGGDSPNSNEASATPLSAPVAPTNLAATSGNASASLSWSASTNATSYQVFRSLTSGVYPASPTQTVTTASFSDSGLTNGTTYYYVVKAIGVGGTSAASSEVSATPALPTAPLAPTGFSATAGDGQVSLSWSPSSGATGYKLFRSLTAGGYGATPWASGNSTSFLDTPVTDGTTYYYSVKASNAGGDSPFSTEVSALPVAPPPTPAPIPAPAATPLPNAISAQSTFATSVKSPPVEHALSFPAQQAGQTSVQSFPIAVAASQEMDITDITVNPPSAMADVMNSIKIYNAAGQVIQGGASTQVIYGGTDDSSTPTRFECTSDVQAPVSVSVGTRVMRYAESFNSGSSDPTKAPKIQVNNFPLSGRLANSPDVYQHISYSAIHLKAGETLKLNSGSASANSGQYVRDEGDIYIYNVQSLNSFRFFHTLLPFAGGSYNFDSSNPNQTFVSPSEGDYNLCVLVNGFNRSFSYSLKFQTSYSTKASGHGGHSSSPDKHTHQDPQMGGASAMCPGSNGCGPLSGDPVDLSTGQESYSSGEDLSVYNPKGPNVAFTRYYSNDRAEALSGSPGLPVGWYHTYDVRLESNSTGTNWPPMDLVYPNGARETLSPVVDGSGNLVLNGSGQAQFTAPAGSTYVVSATPLTATKTYGAARVLWSDGTAWNFAAPTTNFPAHVTPGLLASIEAPTTSANVPQYITFQWAGDDRDAYHLVSVCNGSDGRALLALGYSGDPSNGGCPQEKEIKVR